MTTPATDSRLDLEPPSSRVRLWIVLLTFAFPVAAVVISLTINTAFGKRPDLFSGSVALTFLMLVGGVAVFSLLVCGFMLLIVRRHGIVLGSDSIEVATSMQRKRLAVSELMLDEARIVDLQERRDLRPFLKTRGTSLPGYRGGWFRLRNRRKAFIAMAGGPRVLWVPTRNDYDLILQPRQPQALLDRLREMARGR